MGRNRGQLEFDMETIAAGGMGLICGGLALFIMRSAGLGIIWKIMTFAASAVAGFVVSYMIFNK